MAKFILISCMMLMIVWNEALASTPNVDELLDHFTENVDRGLISFVVEIERRTIFGKQASSGTASPPNETQRFSRGEYCWDGQRMRERKHSWGNFGRGIVISEERPMYRCELYDLAQHTIYSSSSSKGLAHHREVFRYLIGSSEKQLMTHLLSQMGDVFGCFLGSKRERLDVVLRRSPTVRVRPQTEVINGIHCYVLEADTPNEKYTVWLDPLHGYNMAKLVCESESSYFVSTVKAFELIDDVWVIMDRVDESKQDGSDYSFHERMKTTKVLLNPDHRSLASFGLDGIPEGTETFLFTDKYQMPGDFVWHHGEPTPCIDKDILIQLDRIAEDLSVRNVTWRKKDPAMMPKESSTKGVN